jgi:hypothetical protein
MHMTFSAFPLLPPKLEKWPFKFLIEQFGPTTKHLNPASVWILAVKDAEEQRLWNISSVNVNITQSPFGTGWVRFWRSYSTQVPRVDPGPTNIIYNIPHPSTLLHISDRTMCNILLLLIQEVKRDIIYRRMNLSASFSTTRHWSTTTCYSPRLYPAQTSFIPPIHRNCQICQSNRVPITITRNQHDLMEFLIWWCVLSLDPPWHKLPVPCQLCCTDAHTLHTRRHSWTTQQNHTYYQHNLHVYT